MAERPPPEGTSPGAPLVIPELSLVVLIGASSSGKSTFARQHFRPTEVLSSDACRALVSDDENSLEATTDAFEVLHTIAGKRLARGLLTVVDATNVQPDARRPLVALARAHYVQPVAIVFDLPEKLCQERSRQRPDRDFGPHVIRRQVEALRRSRRGLQREGFRQVHVLRTPEEVQGAVVERQRMRLDRRDLRGPFDIIGDVHGCFDELVQLLQALGYEVETSTGEDGRPAHAVRHPEGRQAIFLGDLVDRGPRSPDVLRLVMGMVASGAALCVVGNHDDKLRRKLAGRDVRVAHGLAETLAQLEPEAPAFKESAAAFIDSLPSHYVLDGGRLVVAHAGVKAEMQGRVTGRVRDFALYGDTTGEVDSFGLPVRLDWAAGYRGKAMVVYGHTPVPSPEWVNNTINVDTGCVFGGRLTALRYPEKALVSVAAARVYFQPARPLEARLEVSPEAPPGVPLEAPPELPLEMPPVAQQAPPPAPESPAPGGQTARGAPAGLLDVGDVLGRQVVETRLHRAVTIREEQSAAALEVISRFAADPRWLIYLPPTMSPTETSSKAGLLEHPAEAFAYYRREAVERVVCEEKHMGSRAVLVVCRSADVARSRFGVTVTEHSPGEEESTGDAESPGDEGASAVEGGAPEAVGICYTRTGRHFFESRATERALLARVGRAIGGAGLWEELETDWLCLDAELMPWSVKAQALLKQQYAAVGAAARAALPAAVGALAQTVARHTEHVEGTGDGSDGDGGAGGENGRGAVARLLERYQERLGAAGRFVDAYRRYCWEVQSLADLTLAPFQILASEGRVHVQQSHAWHMETLARLAGADPELFLATPYRVVTLADEQDVGDATAWWEALTERGGEGMVVKPLEGVVRGRRGLLQPAIKCRGREYLRLIYGPEYTAPEHLERLRQRGLGAKRSLALREFALGVEGLQRFVEREPLYRVHQCAFGVLALESEPVDPRL